MNFVNNVERKVVGVIRNEYVFTGLSIFFALYGAMIAPTPGPMFKSIMMHPAVKFLLVALLVLTIRSDIKLALIVATVLVLNSVMSKSEGFDNFSAYNPEYKSITNSRILEARNHVNFRCLDVKMSDLLAAFNGKEVELQKTLKKAFKEILEADKSQDSKQRLVRLAHFAGLPYNVPFTDENAPYIATLLTQWGFDFGKGCSGV